MPRTCAERRFRAAVLMVACAILPLLGGIGAHVATDEGRPLAVGGALCFLLAVAGMAVQPYGLGGPTAGLRE